MKDMIKRIRAEREGFTLAELLIVVAIIAVLVAIAIPVFSAQLEKSRESADAANLRAAYAQVMSAALTGDTAATDGKTSDGVKVTTDTSTKKVTYSMTVDATQTQANWQNKSIEKIGGLAAGDTAGDIEAQTKGKSWTVSCDADGNASITPVIAAAQTGN